MFIDLIIGSLVILVNMVIQVAAVVVAVSYIMHRMNMGNTTPGKRVAEVRKKHLDF